MAGVREVAVLGADPGPTTGLLLAAWDRESLELAECLALECTASMAPKLLALLLSTPYGRLVRAAGIEAFVARGRSQSLRGVSTAAMNAVISELTVVLAGAGVPVRARPAGLVKPWATGRRLAVAGLAAPTEKFTDARDAARHALFTACEECGLPDPLSAVWRTAREARS
jgi:hypothetical protein